MNISDLTITSLETITCFDIITGNYMYTLDELQDATISQTQDSSDITGKGGRKLSSLKKNKAVTISGTNGLLSSGLLEMQTGSKFEQKKTEVLWMDILQVAGGKASTTFKAVGTVGAEITELRVKNANETLGKSLVQNSAVSETSFTYDPATKELGFHTDIVDGTEVVVYYKRQIEAQVLDNMSDKFSGKCRLYIDALAEDKCSNVYRVQIYVPKADFAGEFSIEMGGDQVVHGFEAEALSGACGNAGLFFTYTIFGADTADAE